MSRPLHANVQRPHMLRQYDNAGRWWGCGLNWNPWCCGKTGWEFHLFAFVDALMFSQWRARVEVGVHPREYERLRHRLGWWRSCWPVST